MKVNASSFLDWLTARRVHKRKRFSFGPLALAAFVAVNTTLLLFLAPSRFWDSVVPVIFIGAWMTLIAPLAMLCAMLFLGLMFASARKLNPTVWGYVLAGLASGAVHFALGMLVPLITEQRIEGAVRVLGGFWTTASKMHVPAWWALIVECIAGSLAGLAYAVVATRRKKSVSVID